MNVQAPLEELDGQGYTPIREFLSAAARRRMPEGLARYWTRTPARCFARACMSKAGSNPSPGAT